MSTTPTANDYRQFLRGEKSWAELEGVTPQETQEIVNMGCALAAADRLEEAKVIFEGLVAGDDKNSGFRAALGTVYHKLNRFVDARAAYEKALEQDENNVVAMAGRGELRLRTGDNYGIEDLVRALALDPEMKTAAGHRAKELLTIIAETGAKGDGAGKGALQ